MLSFKNLLEQVTYKRNLTNLRVTIYLLIICPLLFIKEKYFILVFLTMSQGMWDLKFSDMDQSCASTFEAGSLIHGTAREVLIGFPFKNRFKTKRALVDQCLANDRLKP